MGGLDHVYVVGTVAYRKCNLATIALSYEVNNIRFVFWFRSENDNSGGL